MGKEQPLIWVKKKLEKSEHVCQGYVHNVDVLSPDDPSPHESFVETPRPKEPGKSICQLHFHGAATRGYPRTTAMFPTTNTP